MTLTVFVRRGHCYRQVVHTARRGYGLAEGSPKRSGPYQTTDLPFDIARAHATMMAPGSPVPHTQGGDAMRSPDIVSLLNRIFKAKEDLAELRAKRGLPVQTPTTPPPRPKKPRSN